MAHPKGVFEPFPANPGKTFAFGLTYLGHIKESGEKIGDPVLFDKTCRPLPAPETVQTPSSEKLYDALQQLDSGIADRLKRSFDTLPVLLDYEVELGLVLLEPVSAERLTDPDWMPQIGYFIANDLTARSVQIAGQLSADRYAFWAASKSLPEFMPVSSEIWRPAACDGNAFPDVRLSLKVNGVERQSESVQDMIFSPRQMIEIVSERNGGALNSGDIILTGTPSGVALGMSRLKQIIARLLPASLTVPIAIKSSARDPSFLRSGDHVEQSAGWLGTFDFKIA